MSRCLRPLLILALLSLFSTGYLGAQDDPGWRISPRKINIQLGQDRPLQVLDDNAQELSGAIWAVDNPRLADLTEDENGRVVVHSKATGTVRVSASLLGESRFREITIWGPSDPLPQGTTRWGMMPMGRELGDLPAVPTGSGPDIYSLEANSTGTYLRAVRNDGIQVWTWLMPERAYESDLVFGDWLGGALISASRRDSFTVYAVGKDGKLRWSQAFPGVRESQADSLDHQIHIVTRSEDGIKVMFTSLNETTGKKNFELSIPASQHTGANVRLDDPVLVCSVKSTSVPVKTNVSRVFVNIDGFSYIAFTQSDWRVSAGNCRTGASVSPHDAMLERNDKIVLWQIHSDGTYRGTVVEQIKNKQPFSEPVSTTWPSGTLIPDGLNGELVAIRSTTRSPSERCEGSKADYVYRIGDSGELMYKFLLPQPEDPLHDEMVLGHDNRGFATRGSLLVAFSVESGKELWRWDSSARGISVYAALANGGVAVQTPDGLVQVENGEKTRVLLKGIPMMNWQGEMFLKHH